MYFCHPVKRVVVIGSMELIETCLFRRTTVGYAKTNSMPQCLGRCALIKIAYLSARLCHCHTFQRGCREVPRT